MRSISPVISIIFAVIAVAAIAAAQSARAQTQPSGDPSGHGSCMLISSPDASSGLSGFSFDTFMIERASRLMTATSRWQPVNSARPSHVTRVQFTVARTSAPR